MEQFTGNERAQRTTRRAFLKQVFALSGVSAGTALLAACGAAGTTATAVPVAQQPTTAPTTGAAPTAATISAATSGTMPTSGATSAAAAPTAGTSATASTAQNATPKIVAAANAFLATLSDAEKGTVSFDWTDTAQKQRWSNFPEGAFKHAGLMMGNMSETQQTACLAVLQTLLSTEGYNRVIAEWKADDANAAQSGSSGGAPMGTPGAGAPMGTPGAGGGGGGGGMQVSFGTPYYFAAIIGTPSETSAWQWQWGGHHITVNATIVGPNISLTPTFVGVQPMSYTDANGATVRPLGDIEDDAFALVNALDATQQKTAVLSSSLTDLVLGPGQDGKTIQSEGLSAAQMNADQKTALLKLIGHYTGLINDENAAVRTAEIQANLDQTFLAWYGPTTKGDPAYFRVTGPTIVIEYAPQASQPGQAIAAGSYHVHGMYRDPTNDYGAKYTGIEVKS